VILPTLLLAACVGEPPTPKPRTPTPAPTVVSIPTDTAVTFNEGTVLDSTKEQPENETPSFINQMQFSKGFLTALSHDQKSIAVVDGSQLCKYGADALTLDWCTENPDAGSAIGGLPVWSQDDSQIVSFAFSRVLLFDATSGHVQQIKALAGMSGDAVMAVSVNTCPSTYLVSFDSGKVGFLNVEAGKYDKVIQISKKGIFAASWLRCDEQITATVQDRTQSFRDIKANRDLYRIENLDTVPSWSPDRSTFAIGIDRHVAIVTPGQGEPSVRSLAVSDSTLAWVTWSPDGRVIAATNQDSTTLWDASSGKALYHLPVQARLAFSEDGTRFAAVEKSGQVTIWDLSTGKMLYRLADTQYILFRRIDPTVVFISHLGSLFTLDLK